MSHEIRTPMNAILGMTHLALKTNPPPKLADYLNKIKAAAQALPWDHQRHPRYFQNRSRQVESGDDRFPPGRGPGQRLNHRQPKSSGKEP